MSDPQFDPDEYRHSNHDLRAAGLTDVALREHFDRNGRRERRPYAATETTVATMSMKWLRGRGLEVGAGDIPTPLFGDAEAVQADKDDTFVFGGSSADRFFDIEDALPQEWRGTFDFMVASHVLEHCNSLIRAFENLVLATKPGGVVYIVVPDVRYLPEQTFMPNYTFPHHVAEYEEPLRFRAEHDRLHCVQNGADLHANDINLIDEEYARGLAAGVIPLAQRFIYHKHNYSFGDWSRLFLEITEFYGPTVTLEDSRTGRERMDCHFVFIRRGAPSGR